MITYLSFRGQFPIYAWFFASVITLIFCIVIIGKEATPGTEQDLQLWSTIIAAGIMSDYIIGFLSLYSLKFYSAAKRRKFVCIGYLVVAGPALIWYFGDKVHPSTWVGPDPLFASGYLRYIGGFDLHTVEIDRSYYVPNVAKTNEAAKRYQEALAKPATEQATADALEQFKGTLVEAKGLQASLGPGKVSITIEGLDTDYNQVLLSVKGTLSVRGTNRISEIFQDVHSDDFRFSVLDYTELSNQNSYVLPFQSSGLGFRDDQIFENEGADLGTPAAIAFSRFIDKVGSR